MPDDHHDGGGSPFPIAFTKISDQLYKWWRAGMISNTEARDNLGRAGLELGDDGFLDPMPIHLPDIPDDDDYGDGGSLDDGDVDFDDEEAA